MGLNPPPAAVLRDFGNWLQRWAEYAYAQAELLEQGGQPHASDAPSDRAAAPETPPDAPQHWRNDAGPAGPPAHWLALFDEPEAGLGASRQDVEAGELPGMAAPLQEWIQQIQHEAAGFLREDAQPLETNDSPEAVDRPAIQTPVLDQNEEDAQSPYRLASADQPLVRREDLPEIHPSQQPVQRKAAPQARQTRQSADPDSGSALEVTAPAGSVEPLAEPDFEPEKSDTIQLPSDAAGKRVTRLKLHPDQPVLRSDAMLAKTHQPELLPELSNEPLDDDSEFFMETARRSVAHPAPAALQPSEASSSNPIEAGRLTPPVAPQTPFSEASQLNEAPPGAAVSASLPQVKQAIQPPSVQNLKPGSIIPSVQNDLPEKAPMSELLPQPAPAVQHVTRLRLPADVKAPQPERGLSGKGQADISGLSRQATPTRRQVLDGQAETERLTDDLAELQDRLGELETWLQQSERPPEYPVRPASEPIPLRWPTPAAGRWPDLPPRPEPARPQPIRTADPERRRRLDREQAGR